MFKKQQNANRKPRPPTSPSHREAQSHLGGLRPFMFRMAFVIVAFFDPAGAQQVVRH
jgi:hypothetical protein